MSIEVLCIVKPDSKVIYIDGEKYLYQDHKWYWTNGEWWILWQKNCQKLFDQLTIQYPKEE